MQLIKKAIAACVLLSVSPLSWAEVYVGGGGVMSTFKYDNVKHGFGPDVFAGYRAETIPMMFEVEYLSTGKNKVENPVDIYDGSGNYVGTVYDPKMSFSGTRLSVGYYGKFDPNGSGFYGKVGYYSGKSKFEGTDGGSNSGSITGTSNGFTFGLGVDWMINRVFGLRFDLSSLVNTKAIPDSDQKSNITTFGLGAIFAFGGSSNSGYRVQAAPVYSPPVPAPAPQAYVPEAAPVAAAPAPAPAPAPVETPVAPVAAPQAPAAQFVPGAQVVVVAGGAVRGQPSTQSAVVTTLPNGRGVRLDSQRIDNAEGSWWLVSGDRLKGWVNEKDLQH